MRWKLFNGKEVWKRDNKYRIDFDKPSRSKQQFQIKQFLRENCRTHILYEEYTLPRMILKVDFINATQKWALEHQGVGHNSFNPFFHQGSRARYLNSIKNDSKKREFLEFNNYLLIETTPDDLPLTKEWFIEKYGVYL
jgi:hypothetical protein